MIDIKIDGLEEALQDLGELRKKMPSIAARTLTTLAYDAKKEVEGWLPRVLDRPTPYTMKSLFVFPAKKTTSAQPWHSGTSSGACPGP